jgi:Ca2+-binding EF-hand superfamily protein
MQSLTLHKIFLQRLLRSRARFRATGGIPKGVASTLAVLGGGAFILAWYSPPQDNWYNRHTAVTYLEASMPPPATPGPSLSSSQEFQLQAALEFKEEMQRMKLARFLHELMDLARKSQQSPVKNLKRYKTEWLDHHDHGTIDLRGINIRQLKTGEAMYIIEQILNKGGKLCIKSIVQICQLATEVLLREPTLLDRRNDRKTHHVTVVGDLHGSLPSLQKVLELADDFRGDPNHCLVFDGDFVDRGDDSLEVFMVLLLLKIAVPDKVLLIRGNHEDSMVAKVYGFSQELKEKYQLSDPAMEKVWRAMSETFAAFPLGMVTDTSFIVHGGLPSKEFRLDHLRQLSAKERSQCHTLVHPRNKTEQMIESLLWSDPSRRKGIHPSPRGTGVKFGRDVALEFLQRENLKYLVRGHEPVEEGIKELDCGDDRHVITVFSAANYPNDLGHNVGGLLHLTSDGKRSHVTFNYRQSPNKEGLLNSVFGWAAEQSSALFSRSSEKEGPPEDKLRSYVTKKKSDLVKAFAAVEDKEGLITRAEWAHVMHTTLDLGVVDWGKLQQELAPTTRRDGDHIDWREYVITHTTNILETLADKKKMDQTVDWMDKMLVIFEYLDLDMDGVVRLPEFTAGTRLLNRYHLHKLRQISDPAELFSRFDDNGDGAVGLGEFKEHLDHSHMVAKMTQSVGRQQVKTMAKNVDLLKTAFSFMDVEGTGTVTFAEWQQCIDLLNKQLHRNEKVYDAKELFSLMDIDGSGEIDLEEFEQVFGSLV